MTVSYDPFKTVPLEDFLPELRLEFSALSDDVLLNYVKKSIIQLCKWSNVLCRSLIINTSTCINTYSIEPPDCVEFLTVQRFKWISGCCCDNYSSRHICRYIGDNVIELGHSFDGSCEVVISVTPTMSSCDVPVELYDKYYNIIILGARAELFKLHAMPWSNISYGISLSSEFRVKCNEAGVNRLLGPVVGMRKMETRRIV